jgi:hypothetical protein
MKRGQEFLYLQLFLSLATWCFLVGLKREFVGLRGWLVDSYAHCLNIPLKMKLFLVPLRQYCA